MPQAPIPRWQAVAQALREAQVQGIEPVLTLPQSPGRNAMHAIHLEPTLYTGDRLGFYSCDYVRVYYMESGSGVFHLGSRSVLLARGGFLIIPPHHRSSHVAFRATMRDQRSTSCWRFAFGRGPVFLSERASGSGPPWPFDPLAAFARIEGTGARLGHIPRCAQDDWARYCVELTAEMNSPALDRDARIRALSALMYAEALRASSRNLPKPPVNSIVAEVLAFVHANANRKVEIGAIAAHVHRTPAYVKAVVQEHTGQSLDALLQSVRLRVVRRALVQTSESIDDLAVRFDFEDARAVTKEFTSVHGITPMAYRGLHAGTYAFASAKRVTFLTSDMVLVER